MKKFHALMLLLALGLAACGGNAAEAELADAQATAAELSAQLTAVADSEEEEATEEPTAAATETQAPTATQEATSTPEPTATDTPTPTATPTPYEVPDWSLFRNNDEGPEVYAIQQLLRVHGYDLTVDGDFGPQTRARVMAFQSDNGLAADGIVGPNTWEALIDIPLVKDGSLGRAVRAVQHLLSEKFGYDEVAVDGDFGPITDAAVRDFQAAYDLDVDGLVGPNTWHALISIQP